MWPPSAIVGLARDAPPLALAGFGGQKRGGAKKRKEMRMGIEPRGGWTESMGRGRWGSGGLREER